MGDRYSHPGLSGRPLAIDGQKTTHTLTCRLSEEEFRWVENRARITKQTLAMIMRKSIRNYREEVELSK